MLIPLLLVAVSIGLLYLGGEMLVRYATVLAVLLRISPIVIGLTVIAFGTSAPELAAAVSAALNDAPSLAVGNVVGSNIANIALILALALLVSPVTAERTFLRREMPLMIGTAVLVVAFVATGSLNRWQAAVLLVLMALFLRSMLVQGGVDRATETSSSEDAPEGNPWLALGGAAVGIALLVFGADLMVTNAEKLARQVGISERVIGLTLVAFGTSVPELASGMVAAFRKQADLLLGNIVGSNIFNTLLILPSALLVRPFPVEFATFGLDALVALAFGLALWVFFLLSRGRRIHRTQGIVLLVGYIGYIGYLGLSG